MDCIRWCRNRNFYISLETQLSTAEKASVSLWTFFTKSLIDVCYELATLKCTYRHQRHRRWRRAGDSRRRQLEDRCCIVVAAAAAKKKSIFCRKYFQEVVKTFDAQKVVAPKKDEDKKIGSFGRSLTRAIFTDRNRKVQLRAIFATPRCDFPLIWWENGLNDKILR